MNLLRLLLSMSFLNLSCIYSTADEISVVIGPNNTLIFLIGEIHDTPNENVGGNEAVIQKVLDILKSAEGPQATGYRLFIERADSGLFSDPKDLDTKDLLSGIIRRAGVLKNSSICDIEIRKVSSAAQYILCGEDPNKLASCFRGESSKEQASQEIRERCQHSFQCDLNEITFEDVFDEFNGQLEWLKATSPNWRRYEHSHVVALSSRLRKLEELLLEFGISKKQNILSMALDLWKKGRNTYHYVQESLFLKIKGITSELFDLVLFDRLLVESSISSQKPIIVIAGGNHTSTMEQELHYMVGVTPKLRIFEFDDGRHRMPLKPDYFEALEKPLVYYTPPKAWQPCLLL